MRRKIIKIKSDYIYHPRSLKLSATQPGFFVCLFLFFDYAYSMQKFLGHGSNPSHRSDKSGP